VAALAGDPEAAPGAVVGEEVERDLHGAGEVVKGIEQSRYRPIS
jgi:hypothetical protein